MNELDMLRTRMLRQMQGDAKIVIDFGKNEQVRVEGEIWTEDNKEWIFTDGVIKKLSQIANVTKSVNIPNFCPKCKKKILHEGDVHMYKIHGSCLKCVIEFETKLRIAGKWDEYVKNTINNEIDWKIDKLQQELSEYFEFTKDKDIMDINFHTETISNDIDDATICKNVQKKLEYLQKLKIA